MNTPPDRLDKTDDGKHTRILTFILAAVCISVGILVAFVIFSVPNQLSTHDVVSVGARTDEISACRSVANTRVTDARNLKVEAERLETRASNTVNVLTNQITELAVYDSENPLLQELRLGLDAARNALVEAEEITDEAADLEVDAAKQYAKLVKLSLDDPDQFLELCEEGF